MKVRIIENYINHAARVSYRPPFLAHERRAPLGDAEIPVVGAARAKAEVNQAVLDRR